MDKLEQLLTKMNSEFVEYEAWLLQQPASVILENAFQYTTKQDILMHAESVDLSPAQLETLLHLKAPLEEVFETYRNTDSDFLMLEMHDAMETCADDTMAVQRTTPVYTQPPDYAREHGFTVFTTTLASSRWKRLDQINEAGRLAAARHPGTLFWEQNWRKGGLQERRGELLRQYGFYNQQYCGCEFSLRARQEHDNPDNPIPTAHELR